ncbi:MAG: hypothetical protein ACOYS2_02205, partial [Patescibacteria group bacterium]
MENIEFLKKYQKLQQGIMFDKLIDLKHSIFGFSQLDKTAFWNFALVLRNINKNEFSEIEEKIISMNRNLVIYVEDS